MPLLVNRDHVSQSSRSAAGKSQNGSLSRIVSDMNVSALQSDSVGLNRFLQDMSTLLSQGQVKSSSAEVSVH